MADEVKSHEHGEPKVPSEVQSPVETTERGLLDFMGKKEEEKPQEAIASEFEQKVQVSEPEKKDEEEVKKEEEEKKPGLLEKLHRTGSSSSSSSEEEEGEGGEKKKKKKEKGKTKEEGTSVPVEKTQEEKKGFLEKIKEKLPGHGKKQEEHVTSTPPPPPPPSTAGGTTDQPPAEKKGLLEKIKEKLPGYHHCKSAEPQEKKEKESD